MITTNYEAHYKLDTYGRVQLKISAAEQFYEKTKSLVPLLHQI